MHVAAGRGQGGRPPVAPTRTLLEMLAGSKATCADVDFSRPRLPGQRLSLADAS